MPEAIKPTIQVKCVRGANSQDRGGLGNEGRGRDSLAQQEAAQRRRQTQRTGTRIEKHSSKILKRSTKDLPMFTKNGENTS
jgi:hypothetical protein